MPRIAFTLEWIQTGENTFQAGRKAAYWKGQKGWWASRQGHDGIRGPFRTPGSARAWAEEPLREAHRAKVEAEREAARQAVESKKARRAAKAARDEAAAAAREAKAQATWGMLPPEERRLSPGQVWAMKAAGFESHQVLVVEVKKRIVVVLSRANPQTPWKGLPRQPQSLGTLPRLYRLVGQAKVPASAKG